MRNIVTAAEHCGKNRVMGPSVRSHLVAGGAVAGAGILAVSLVVAPPRLDSARAEFQAMRLAAVVSPSEAPPGALLAQRIYDQTRIVLPAAAFVGRDIADIVTGAATTPLTIDPAADGKQTNDTALAAAAPAGIDLSAILGPLINNAIVGPIVLVGALLFGFLVVLPVYWAVETVYEAVAGVLGLPPTLPLPGTVTATASATFATAEPQSPADLVVENAKILGEGLLKTASQVPIAVLGDAALVPTTLFLAIAAPTKIPTVLAVASAAHTNIWTGAGTIDGRVPGYFVPLDVTPTGDPTDARNRALASAINGNVPGAMLVALNTVGGNLTAAGAPKVVEQPIRSTERIGVTLVQAQTLLSTSGFLAIQDFVDAAVAGSGGRAALERGVTRIPQAVFGDPSAPDAHVDPFGLSSPTAPSVAKRGAVGTVISGVQQAVTEWGDSLDTTAAAQTRVATDTGPRTPGSSLTAGATVLRAQGLTRVSTLGAVRRTLGLDTAGTAGHPQGTPVRDAVKKAGSDVNKAVTTFTDRVKAALSGGSDDAGE